MLALVLVPLLRACHCSGSTSTSPTQPSRRRGTSPSRLRSRALPDRPPVQGHSPARCANASSACPTAPILSRSGEASATAHAPNPLWTDHRGHHLLDDPASRIAVELAAREDSTPAVRPACRPPRTGPAHGQRTRRHDPRYPARHSRPAALREPRARDQPAPDPARPHLVGRRIGSTTPAGSNGPARSPIRSSRSRSSAAP